MMDFGNVIEVRPVALKAQDPNFVTLLDNLIDLRLEHPLNA